jgi:ankyrin repeat protein
MNVKLRIGRIVTGALVAWLAMTSQSTMWAAGSSALADAAQRGDVAAARAILQRQRSAVKVVDADGTTPLHIATDQNNPAMVELLIRAGADVTAKNRFGITPLHSAALYGNAAILERLLKAGADPNTALPEGETALMTAAGNGSVEAIKVLLAHGGSVNVREAWKQQTALMWAAHEGNADAVRALLEAGANVNDRSIFGWTPLLFAVRQGEVGTIKALLAGGANIHDTLPDGTGGLVTAVFSLNYEAASVLLDYGIDPNADEQGWTALHQIMLSRRPHTMWRNPGQTAKGGVSSLDLIRKLVAKGADVNARLTKEPSRDLEGRNTFNRFGATPLLLAAKNVDVPAMKVLLEVGADPFLATVEGATPLMVAAGVGVYSQGENPGLPEESADAVKLLLGLGAPATTIDKNGDTALHGPAWRGSNEAVKMLVNAGAQLDAKNEFGWMPLTIAKGVYYNCRVMMNPHTAELLEELMVARGIAVDQENKKALAENGQRKGQSGGLRTTVVIDDVVNAQNPSEVKDKLLEQQMRRETMFRQLLEKHQDQGGC